MMFLKGDQAYKFQILQTIDEQNHVISYGKVYDSWPRLISTVFPRVPNDIDSAYTTYCDYKTIFFKDDFLWLWQPNNKTQKHADGPYKVSKIFPGLCM